MLPYRTYTTSKPQSWTVEHWASEEPEAEPYLNDTVDDWDCSTLASTPSLKRGLATILRNGGEPSHIIISVEDNLSMSKRALRRFWKAFREILHRLRRQKALSSGISNTSTAQPSLGVMGVMV